MLIEAVATVLTIGTVFGASYLVEWWLGVNAKFFGFIPVSWTFDAVHVAVILRLCWRVLRKFNDDN